MKPLNLLRHRRFPAALATLLVLGLHGNPAGAAVIQTFATGAGFEISEISTNPPTISESADDSGLEQVTSFVQSSAGTTDGSAKAESSFAGAGPGINTAVLKAIAAVTSTFGSASAYAYGVDVFSNDTGANINAVQLNLVLDAELAQPVGTASLAAASAVVFKADSTLLSDLLDDVEAQNLSSLTLDEQLAFIVNQAGTLGALVDTTAGDLILIGDTGGAIQSESTTLDVGTVANGESVVYFNFLLASTLFDGAVADAFGTLTTTVVNGAGLTSASATSAAAVPEPGVFGLMAVGGLMVFAQRRRRRA